MTTAWLRARKISAEVLDGDKIRSLHDELRIPYVEVHVATPADVCAERDRAATPGNARAT